MDLKRQEIVQKGDILAFPRKIYKHFGICDGEGKVIHFDGSIDQKGADAIIRRDDLHEVAGSSGYRVCNKLDHDHKPFLPTEIVSRAESMLGYSDYNIFSNNCEHFATWCRYGIAESEQSMNVLGYIFTFAVLLPLIWYCLRALLPVFISKWKEMLKSSPRCGLDYIPIH